jgi:nucleotide-binding universal stress UspA family protein
MLKSLLVGLDGSEYSEGALRLALEWAKPNNAVIGGIAVVDIPGIFQAEAVPLGAEQAKEALDQSRLADARKHVDHFLSDCAARAAKAGVPCKLIESAGQPEEQIMIESQRFDLLLLGRQTRFHFETEPRDSSLLPTVLKGSVRPVVVAPQKPAGGECVVLATDGRPGAARAAWAFVQTGLLADLPVHVVSGLKDPQEAARAVDRLGELLRWHGRTVQEHALEPDGSIAEMLLGQVNHHKAALLVMGAHGRSGLSEFLFGSTTREVLGGSPVPVFLTH